MTRGRPLNSRRLRLAPRPVDVTEPPLPIPWGDAIIAPLVHRPHCRRDGFDDWHEVVTAEIWGFYFALYAPRCCAFFGNDGWSTQHIIEDWCGLALAREDWASKILRDGDREYHDAQRRPRWRDRDSCERAAEETAVWVALRWVFRNMHHRWYLVADLVRTPLAREWIRCHECDRPFPAWDQAERLARVFASDDVTSHYAFFVCSAACRAAREARWQATCEANARAAAERERVEARQLWNAARKLATSPRTLRRARHKQASRAARLAAVARLVEEV